MERGVRMIKYLIGGAVGFISAIGVTRLYNEIRYRREEAELTALFDNHADDSEPMPAFNVDDSVLVIDPNMADMGGDLLEIPRPYTVTNIAYVENLDTFTYQLDNEPYWYNENWLMPDIYGPKTWHVVPVSDDNSKEIGNDAHEREIDYWLASLSHEQRKGNEVGVQQAINELNRLRGENDDRAGDSTDASG